MGVPSPAQPPALSSSVAGTTSPDQAQLSLAASQSPRRPELSLPVRAMPGCTAAVPAPAAALLGRGLCVCVSVCSCVCAVTHGQLTPQRFLAPRSAELPRAPSARLGSAPSGTAAAARPRRGSPRCSSCAPAVLQECSAVLQLCFSCVQLCPAASSGAPAVPSCVQLCAGVSSCVQLPGPGLADPSGTALAPAVAS